MRLRRNVRELTIFPKVKPAQNPLYHYTKQTYQDFLTNFDKKMDITLEKQNYRIYLQLKNAQKTHEKLIEEKRQLHREIQVQRLKKNVQNMSLEAEINQLSKLNEQFDKIKQKYETAVAEYRKTINEKKIKNNLVQSKIKQTWRGMQQEQINNSHSSVISTIKASYADSYLEKSFSYDTNRFPSIYDYLKVYKKVSDEKINNKLDSRKQLKAHELIDDQKQKVCILKLFAGFIKRTLQFQKQDPQKNSVTFQDLDVCDLLKNMENAIQIKQSILQEMANVVELR